MLVIAREWSLAMKNYMNGMRDLMMTGVDQLTKAMCVSEGKGLREV